MIFRIYHETAGDHTHCRVFAGLRDGALAKRGTLVFRNEEFAEFVMSCPSIQFRLEEKDERTRVQEEGLTP